MKIIYSNINKEDNCDRDCEGYCECARHNYEAELINLDKKLEGEIIAIADIGTWRGRRSGYKMCGNNLKNILYTDNDYSKWFIERRNVKAVMHHHDGTNYVEYREVRPGRDIKKLQELLYNQEEVSRQQINYYTRSIYPYVAEIYGW